MEAEDNMTQIGTRAQDIATLAQAFHIIEMAERDVNFNRPQDINGSKEALNVAFTSLMVELGELAQELDIKPWKIRNTPPDPAKVAEEFADVIAFFGVLMINVIEQVGIDPSGFAWSFIEKTETNIQRAKGRVEGYKPGNGIGT
jgi:NTP pyrophosphatase (non-canonical NTP hydrolase)